MLLAFKVLEGLRCLLPSKYALFALSLIPEKRLNTFAFTECDTFSRSSDAVFELSLRFAEPFKHDLDESKQLEAKRLMFHELTQVCLWGNSTDLSLLINVSRLYPIPSLRVQGLTRFSPPYR